MPSDDELMEDYLRELRRPPRPPEVPETTTGLAFNGHTMVYPWSHMRENGEPVYSSALAWCAEGCRACAAGDPLPDW